MSKLAIGDRVKILWTNSRPTKGKLVGYWQDTCQILEDGGCNYWVYEHALRKLKPKKKMVSKIAVYWVNIYEGSDHGTYTSEEDANDGQGDNRIACVKVTGSYEVEE